MTLTSALYLTDLVENINTFCGILFISAMIIGVPAFFGSIMCLDAFIDKTGKAEIFWKNILKKWWILLLLTIPLILAPSKKTMYLMLGANYLQQSNLPGKVGVALELKLDEYIAELTQKNKINK